MSRHWFPFVVLPLAEYTAMEDVIEQLVAENDALRQPRVVAVDDLPPKMRLTELTRVARAFGFDGLDFDITPRDPEVPA